MGVPTLHESNPMSFPDFWGPATFLASLSQLLTATPPLPPPPPQVAPGPLKHTRVSPALCLSSAPSGPLPAHFPPAPERRESEVKPELGSGAPSLHGDPSRRTAAGTIPHQASNSGPPVGGAPRGSRAPAHPPASPSPSCTSAPACCLPGRGLLGWGCMRLWRLGSCSVGSRWE